jgi:hypothetical protein
MLAGGEHAREGRTTWKRDKNVQGTEKKLQPNTGLRSCVVSSNENKELDELLMRSETLHPSA